MGTAERLGVARAPARAHGAAGRGPGRAQRTLGILLWIALVLTVIGIGAS